MVGARYGHMSSPVMVGRELESGRIGRALAGLADGRAPLIVISGEAGIGKSRLIDETLARMGPAIRVLRTECLALGSRIPYLPFAELLRDLARQVPAATLSGVVGSSRTELSLFLPQLTTAFGTPGDDAHESVRSHGDDLE
ncbi:MAG: AAA family ATPase, partial [Candidatus Limnocylindrales bacterium]